MGFTDFVSDAGLTRKHTDGRTYGVIANCFTVLDNWVKTRSYIVG